MTQKKCFTDESLAAFVYNTKDYTNAQIDSIPQGDWNQNDETAKDYIKNRPFYISGTEEVVILEENTLDYSSESTVTANINAPLKEQATYIVTWNGIEYAVTSTLIDYGSVKVIVLGNNQSINGIDTGEPFVFSWFEGSNSINIQALDNSTTVIASIIALTEQVQELDEKYIPDSIKESVKNSAGLKVEGTTYTIRDVEGNDVEIVAEVGAEVFNLCEPDNYNITNKAIGEYSHAEGYGTTAYGNYSHAEGIATEATGSGSHSEGEYTKAIGNFSHAEGYDTTASGRYSHAEGYLTTASSEAQHVQGKYNILDEDSDGNPLNRYAHIVGNGEISDNRSNAHTVDWEGNAWFAGDVYVGSTSGTNKDEGSKKLVTEDKLNDYYLKTEADTLHSELHSYVDTEVASLVNSAPETLDTIGELAAAFEENKEVVEALDASITNKQDKISDSLILVDTVTGAQYKIQIQSGQLVSFPIG